MVNGGGSFCTTSNPCPACTGDCDNDSQCQIGLTCVQRNAGEAPPLACIAGGSGDVDGHDYWCTTTTTSAAHAWSIVEWLRCLLPVVGLGLVGDSWQMALLVSVFSADTGASVATPLQPAGPTMNLVETLVSMPDTFSTLVTAVTTAGLAPTLSGAGPFTVFAPNNAAFAALGDAAIQSLLANPRQLADILTYHVASGHVLSTQLRNGMQVACCSLLSALRYLLYARLCLLLAACCLLLSALCSSLLAACCAFPALHSPLSACCFLRSSVTAAAHVEKLDCKIL